MFSEKCVSPQKYFSPDFGQKPGQGFVQNLEEKILFVQNVRNLFYIHVPLNLRLQGQNFWHSRLGQIFSQKRFSMCALVPCNCPSDQLLIHTLHIFMSRWKYVFVTDRFIFQLLRKKISKKIFELCHFLNLHFGVFA